MGTTGILAISGSLRSASHNTALLRAAAALAPSGVEITRFAGLAKLPPYSEELDVGAAPAPVRELREAITRADAVLVATPEYNRSIPGGLKNAIDWASRPYGKNSFARKPSTVIGTSPGKIGTAVGQQHLRSILSFCNSPQMNSIEAYIQFTPGLIDDNGEVADAAVAEFLRNYMQEFHAFITRVYTALPRTA